jgi:glycine betaine/choline ABC-type transport system substrate-binding protein
LAALAVVAIAACGSSDKKKDTSSGGQTPASSNLIVSDSANASKPTIKLGTKNFTEALVVGEIYEQALKAAGYKVKPQFNLGSEQIAYKALKAGQIDAYPEYTGTALTSFFKVQTADIPKSAATAYDQARADYAKEGITALQPTPFTDSNGFALTAATAKKLGNITKLSQLSGKSQNLTVSGPPECRQRVDCYLGLQKVYGLKFKKFLSIDIAKRHEALTGGQSDVGEVFTTDGQIHANHEVLLEDDKGLFPPYNMTLTAKTSVVNAAGPDFTSVINKVQAGLTTAVMQELNSRVDLDKVKPADAARQYLQAAGFVK